MNLLLPLSYLRIDYKLYEYRSQFFLKFLLICVLLLSEITCVCSFTYVGMHEWINATAFQGS